MTTNAATKPSILISYVRADDKPIKRLYHDLKAKFDVVWRDRVSMPNRGSTFLQEIRVIIDHAVRLLLVAGTDAFTV